MPEYTISTHDNPALDGTLYQVIAPHGSIVWQGIGEVAHRIACNIVALLNYYQKPMRVREQGKHHTLYRRSAFNDARYLKSIQDEYPLPEIVLDAMQRIEADRDLFG